MEDPNPPGAAAPPNKLGVVGWPKSPPVVDVGDWKKFVAAGAAGCCWPNAPGVVLAPKGEVAKPQAGVLGAWPYAGVLAACPKAPACPPNEGLAAKLEAGAGWPPKGVKGLAGVAGGVPKD